MKVGVLGAEECGEMEEWFNYRMCRAAPDVCAKYMGSFRADTTRGQFTEGGKWLVWKYEVLILNLLYCVWASCFMISVAVACCQLLVDRTHLI